jgi:hypothetical protein
MTGAQTACGGATEVTWHECSACDGTGERINYVPSGINGGKLLGADYIDLRQCPVCRGSGRISDRMPVTDAIADAETLLLHAMAGATETARHIVDARELAYMALGGAIDFAAERGQMAARAAVLAVPGLGRQSTATTTRRA